MPTVDQDLRKAASLSARGQAADAERIYRAVLERFPNNKRARDGLSILFASTVARPSEAEIQRLAALYHRGRFCELLVETGSLSTRYPASVFIHNIAGAAHAGTGQFADAVSSYDKALALKPDFAEAWSNRGIALLALDRRDDALASFSQAVSLKPDYAEAWSNLGILTKELGDAEAALGHVDAAIRLNPDLASAHANRGAVLLALGSASEAVAACDRAIGLQPAFAEAHCNRGAALFKLGRLEEAVAAYDRAISLRPDYADVHYNRGNALQDMKRLDDAAESYARAIQFGIANGEACNQLLYQRARMCDWAGLAGLVDLPVFGIGTDPVTPFATLVTDPDPARNLARAKAFSRKHHAAAPIGPFAPRKPGRLRIGYFSADFHDHATMYLMARLFEAHDGDRFEVHAFAFGPERDDAMRRRVHAAVDAFHDVSGLDDRAVAVLARDLSIDIAVDLKGHTQHSRLGIFAFRAAPVQITYLGYPGSLGADFIDYIVADKLIIPDASRHHYSEKVIALPGCYQVNDDRRAIADRPFGRAELGLSERSFVFCSFNNTYKITPAEFDIWMRLLSKVGDSQLWLLQDNRWAEANLRREAEARGVAGDRLVFAERMGLADHLARHRCADLFLDSFTVNAHTTASDALWAGLPIVTRLGDGFPARVAGSLLHAVGMPDLVTDSAEAYEAFAFELATDPARLAAVKARLAANLATAPLFDTGRFARNLEIAFEMAHDRRMRGVPPDHIDVPAA